ncbi:MAG TPA: class I SAM-dependent methyltransferase [Clostridiales bacterium]|nr:class I SAM-dependent methyltransferase [Clostridiales bacterium]
MQPYTGFAAVYDMFMDNVPYGEWAAYVQKLLNDYGINQGLVLELGCGTGSMARQLAAKGYDMIGIDNSEEMLQIARDKGREGGDSILYLCQDMREFELYGTVAAVVSVCDSMNYILSEEELLQVFKLVNNYLDPQGIFIFDLDTQYAYEEVLGDTTIAENREEGSFIWENTYYEEEMMNEINLTLFIPEQGEEEMEGEQGTREPQLFRRYEETHYRRAYRIDRVKALIEEAGMEWVAVYEALTKEKPKEDSERVYIIAREKRQKNKLYIKE